jgi:hypothetical protein
LEVKRDFASFDGDVFRGGFGRGRRAAEVQFEAKEFHRVNLETELNNHG